MLKLNKNNIFTYSNIKNNVGFTLIELILVIAFMGILAGLSAPIYNRSQNSNSVNLAAMEFVQSTRRAQALSRASDGDSNWGVYISSGKITLFKGINYVSRDVAYDEDYSIASVIIISGLQEIVFDKLNGDPQSTGSTIFTINTNANKTVTINNKGVLSY